MNKLKPLCLACGDEFSPKRRKIGYTLCLPCGDQKAKQTKYTVVPMNKSNYLLVTDRTLLKQLNPKRTMQ